MALPAPATGVGVRGTMAYFTTPEPAGRVIVLDALDGSIQRQIRVGHTPMAPTLGPHGRMLYVANRFDHTVSLIDLSTDTQQVVKVVREPVAMALSGDGKRLFVANHLPCVRPFLDDENPFIAAEVSVIDTRQRRWISNVPLPNGSQSLRGIAISPDGRLVVVTHILSHYTIPTMRIEGGAMNQNAVSLIDAESMQWVDTVILDDPERGAANPWAVAFSRDGDRLLITHAGTQELSVVDYPALLERLATRRGVPGGHDEHDLKTMAGIRRRVALPVTGPRAVVETDGLVWVPGYFSDDLGLVDLRASPPSVRRVALEPPAEAPLARRGEAYFNDASLCFQHWQSCATCHPDGRSDALYWDLLNDGLGNTKNTKSLLMSTQTPPVMWRGVRADAAAAVRAGMQHIQFVKPQPHQAKAIEAYLRSMKAVPSPHLDASVLETPKTEQASCAKCHLPGVPRGQLTQAARRGKVIFEGKGRCATCHPHPTFTSMRQIDPGLGSGVPYDIPSLIEVWRTAPFLHSGDALSVREAITDFNFMQRRGTTKGLSDQELNDLIEYLKSL
jgi:mono/diheme cytochrome c family protein